MKKLLLSLLLLTITIASQSQELQISGKIRDARDNSPLPQATVQIKGTTNGTISDANGNFRINASHGDTLLFSFIGYAKQEIPVGKSSTINVLLKPDDLVINDVIVIGYGSVRKSDQTGAISSVSSEDFNKGPVTNAEQLIANKIPGVQVIPNSGKPGAGSSFLIRGGASLNAGNDPLIVVDGVPLEGWGDGPGFLSSLNPEDIESFTVLKDASAAAIYGARASNGVILITTSKGAQGKLQFNFTSTASLSHIYKKVPVLNASQYREVAQVASDYSRQTYESLGLGDYNTDWQDVIYHIAVGTENNISMSGGIKNLPYRFSMGYLNQDGILKTSNFERITALLNLTPELFDKHLTLKLSLKGISEKERIADERAISSAISFDPTQPVKTEDSNYGGYFEYEEYASNPANMNGHFNPLGLLEQISSHSDVIRCIGNIQADYKVHFLPDLHLHLNTGYDISRVKTCYFVPADNFEQNISGGDVYNADPAKKVRNTVLEYYLNYIKDISSLSSHIDLMSGYSYNDFLTTEYYYPTYNASGEQIGSDPAYDKDKPRHTLISFYARLNYTLMDKYLLTATVRRDGSSRFSEKNRWGVFPSAALAWKINDESFLKNVETISALKLRIGYGETGQQDGIGNYDYLTTYTAADADYSYQIGNKYYQLTYPSAYDPNRKWEQTATTNAAIDFGFLKNRLGGSVDVYYKKTTDLLNTIDIPSGTNFTSSITKNIGSMENRGIEFTITAKPVKNENFQWDLGFNFSWNKNKITKLSMTDDNEVGLVSSDYLVNTVGYSRNVFYLYHQVYDENGDPLEEVMLDANNDGSINDKDRYRSKSSLPKYILGFNTNLNYKKWSLSMTAHANLGHYIYYCPSDNLVALYGWLVPYNLSTMYYKSKFKMSGNQLQKYSDYYLQNASFLKLDNITLSYDFGKIFKSFYHDAGLRVNASAQNVLTWTNFTGQDPEPSYNWGEDWGSNYPRSRIYELGITLNF